MSVLDTRTGELVPVQANLVTAAPVDAVVANQKAYYALCDALLDDTDWQKIGRGRFKKKSAWTKLAAAFNVSTEVVDDIEVRDEADNLVRAKFRVRATAPNGRSATRTGVATRADSFSSREHDIVATAETRATNRACSALFGLGEVSAEEADGRAMSGGSGEDSGVALEGPPPKKRRSPGRGLATPPKPGPAVPIEGTDALEDRLRALPVGLREAFRDWRRSRGYDWPPIAREILAEMAGEVSVLEAERYAEADTYEPPVGSRLD